MELDNIRKEQLDYTINNLVDEDEIEKQNINKEIKNTKQILHFEFDIKSEEEIFIKLLNDFKNGYRIMKCDEKYSNIDFAIIEEKTLKILYVEYKKRRINMNSKNNKNEYKFKSFFLSKTKLNKINENYYNDKNLNTIIIYDCLDDIYFSLYNKDMLNSYLDIYNNRYELNKSYFKSGYNDMVKFIKNYLKPNKTI